MGSRALARRARRSAPLRHSPLRGLYRGGAVGRGLEGPRRRGATPEIAEEVPLDLFGLITGLPADTARIPWDGPEVRIIEHRAHAVGHAALFIEERGVLVAGDMLSDVLVPMLDLDGAADPIEDYLAALRLFEAVADGVEVVIPGHGSTGGADELRARIDQDRAYVQALRDNQQVVSDPRLGPSAKPGWEWVGDVHDWQAQRLAGRSLESHP
ncbi:MBL fold metallo-hydrolase [Phytohabitans flavus]|uniref:MBL fold metallo-hydrolase n=1 Tax=Phytohabitans flavus TaxID=1076124 RepID=UPI003640A91C